MFSKNAKILTIVIAVFSVISIAAIMTPSSDAEDEKSYQFYLLNTADGYDNTINGWYSATGTSPVDALCTILDENNISYTGFKSDDGHIEFNATSYIPN